jgi:hypothetical protein
MERRELLRLGVATAATIIGEKALGQNSAGNTSGKQGGVAGGNKPVFALDAYGRNLQWARTPEELGKAISDLALASVDLDIGAAPAHVNADKVGSELPAYVSALKAMGIKVRCVTVPITGADYPDAEGMIAAAAAAGAGYYTWSGIPAATGATYTAQLSTLKTHFTKLAQLNQNHRIKGLYQPRQGMAGDQFLDLLPALQSLDPTYTGVRYDTAALLQVYPENMARQLELGARYIGGVAINDELVRLDLPVWKQGRFTGPPELLIGPNGGGDNTGNAGGIPLAYGGGGRPLPYRRYAVPVGTGMVDLTLLGKTLKEINFDGPAECQVNWPLGGAEAGDTISLPRQEVIGRLKRDRIVVYQAFEVPWGLNVLKPPFMEHEGATQGPPGAPDPNL